MVSKMDHDCTSQVLALCRKSPGSTLPFHSLARIFESEGCPVCRLLVHLVKQHHGPENPKTHFPDGREITTYLMFWGPTLRQDDIIGPEVLNIHVSFYRTGSEGAEYLRKGLNIPETYLMDFGYRFELHKGKKELSKADPAVRIFRRKDEKEDGSFDSHFLKSWIGLFKQSHDEKCARGNDFQLSNNVGKLYMIDVKLMSIVRYPPNARYLALSYAWGKDKGWLRANRGNFARLRITNSLTKYMRQIPRTIQDAIILVQRLDERYLWVDSLCIIQDDLDHKIRQLSQMGEVYTNAYLVIVAAHGNNANAGLPGVRSNEYPRRVARAREYLQPAVRLLSHHSGMSKIIGASYWNSRAWTFQESQLASLQLILTNSQAILLCKCSQFSEETLALDHFHFCENGFPELELYPYEGLLRDDSSLAKEFEFQLRNYTKRSLSQQSDIFNAFDAVLSAMKARWNTDFIFGIPMSLFPYSLLWTFDEFSDSLRRRDETIYMRHHGIVLSCRIPTWSWAAWNAPASFYKLRIEDRIILDRTACNLRPVNVIFCSAESEPYATSIRQTLLKGFVWSACFKIGSLPSASSFLRPVMRENGMQVGYAEVHPSQYGYGNADSYQRVLECIAVGVVIEHWGELNNPDYDYHKAGKDKVVHFLIIDRHENDIMARIGTGTMQWRDWLRADPVQKLISLA